MHNTHENNLGKASTQNPTIYIIIQGGNTYELDKALTLTTSQLSVQSAQMLTGNLGFSQAFLSTLLVNSSIVAIMLEHCSYFTFINPVVCNKLGSEGAICTSTSSYCTLSLDQLA